MTVDAAASGNAQQQAGSIAMAPSCIQRRVIIPRRSKGVPKGMIDQAMTNQDSSAGIRSKDMHNSTRKRNGFFLKEQEEGYSSKNRKI